MKKTIRLGFKTDRDQIAYISVPDAPTAVPASSVVKTAMQGIITTNIVRTKQGRLIAPLNARHQGITDIELAVN